MISPEDRAMLERLGKEAKEVPNFYPGDFLNLIQGVDFNILFKICVADDGKIDLEEDKLIKWFLYEFQPKLREDYMMGEEALDIIFNSFFS